MTWRQFSVQYGDPDLPEAVRPCIGPAHLSLLGHAQADHLIARRLGDAAADGQTLAIPGTVVRQDRRVVAQAARDAVKIPPQCRVFVVLSWQCNR